MRTRNRLNLGLLTFAAVVFIAAGDSIKGIHSSLYGLSDHELDRAYSNTWPTTRS